MDTFDIVIRKGTVVDGTNRAPRTADVAVRDGQIVEVGKISGRGAKEFNADGAIVAPGFVDIHTHYDGQATWDARLQPSSLHGVTTIVMGNCGVGFAPVTKDNRARLMSLMEGIEEIPGVALAAGIEWDWNSFPEYLHALERREHDIDLATQVPHAALRVQAMGERAAAYAEASPDEIAVMADLASEAIRAGALGFTTSRTINHRASDGNLTPVYEAGRAELAAIAETVGRTGKGVFQMVADFVDPEADFRLMTEMIRVSRRPMSITVLQNRDRPTMYEEVLRRISSLNSQGYEIRGQVAPRGLGMMLGLQCTLHPFMMNREWQKISHLSPSEQARLMRQPTTRTRILGAQTDEKNENMPAALRIDRYDAMFVLDDPPNYEPPHESSIANQANRRGVTPEEIAYDVLVSSAGGGVLYMPFSNYAYGSLDAVREMLVHPHTVPGLSDGGAHVGTVCDASFPTTLLQYWTRDRSHDRIDLPFAVSRQSRETARAVGLADRGVIAEGYKADINVIDITNLSLAMPEMKYDLPAGSKRFMQQAKGYKHTFVSGVETYRDGVPTGDLPGRLVRGSQAAPQ